MLKVSEKSEAYAVVQAVNALTRFSFLGARKERRLEQVRAAYRETRANAQPRVAVSGSNMAINAAGRAQVLADIYSSSFDTTLTGFLQKKHGDRIWSPLETTPHRFLGIRFDQPKELPSAVLDFVLEHPFDIVHLSKPRFSNILLGSLYKAIWGATVFVDVDDEDLGAVCQIQDQLPLRDVLGKHRSRKGQWRELVGGDGVRVGVPYWNAFDGATVSNAALKQKYDGLILPHARWAKSLVPSSERKASVRREFGIQDDAHVFLFFGTARQHKGVLETAEIVARVSTDKCVFVVAGVLEDSMREQLRLLEGLNLKILPMQPYDRLPDIVGMADACVLSQSNDSLLAKYQLPAKLVDALAMELMVFVSPTPALEEIIEAGCVVSASRSELPSVISDYLSDPGKYDVIRRSGRAYFIDKLSVEACAPQLQQFVMHRYKTETTHRQVFSDRLRSMFDELGGWSMLRRHSIPSLFGN